jgi:hypothetical protein
MARVRTNLPILAENPFNTHQSIILEKAGQSIDLGGTRI